MTYPLSSIKVLKSYIFQFDPDRLIIRRETMPYCPKCGTEITAAVKFCGKCGCDLKSGKVDSPKEKGDKKEPRCPKCGSTNIQVATEGETQGYSLGSGCLGALLFGPFGWLCGLCGMGKGKTRTVRVCAACGKKF
ncbi:MAG: zinc ribbon domain-containing protein [Dehalococcoidia bacterium]